MQNSLASAPTLEQYSGKEHKTEHIVSDTPGGSGLNQNVKRFSADETALKRLVPYETSGRVTLPLVTIHTTGDEIVPYWQEPRYVAKVQTSGKGRVMPIPILRYGHCNFSSMEVLAAFNLLVGQVTDTYPYDSTRAAPQNVG